MKPHRYETTILAIGRDETGSMIYAWRINTYTRPSLRLRIIAWLTGGRVTDRGYTGRRTVGEIGPERTAEALHSPQEHINAHQIIADEYAESWIGRHGFRVAAALALLVSGALVSMGLPGRF